MVALSLTTPSCSDRAEQQTGCGSKLTSPKSVRFGASPATYAPQKEDPSCLFVLDDAVKAQLWYSVVEIKTFKAASLKLAREIAKHDAQINDKRSYHKMLERALRSAEAERTLSSNELSQFFHCVGLSPSRLGLERVSVKALSRHRAKSREELMARVRGVQKMPGLSAEKKEVLLRTQCEKVSRPSRIFARQLAEGLAPEELSLEL